MPKVMITWHTQHDNNVCPICKDIDGYTWTFTEGVPDSLMHPKWGEIWNIHLGSLAHEHKGFKGALTSTCRCDQEAEVDYSDITQKIEQLYDKIMVNAPTEEEMTGQNV